MLYDTVNELRESASAASNRGRSRLNDYLDRMGAEESTQYACGAGRENFKHFPVPMSRVDRSQGRDREYTTMKGNDFQI